MFSLKNKFYFLVFGCALLVGFLYIGPHLLIRSALVGSGQPYVLIQDANYSDEINAYAPRAREVYDGHWPASDVYFESNLPSVFPALPSLFMGSFIYLAGGNINFAYLAALFVFTGAIFFIFYWLAKILVGNKWYSLVLALVGVLTPVAIHLPRAFKSLGLFADIILKNFYPFVQTPLHKLFFARFDDPLLTYPIYLLAIITFILFWRESSRRRAIWAGAFAGLLFHTYFHYAFYWITVLVLLFLYLLCFQRREKEKIKNFIILLAIAALVASPYFINYLRFNNLDWARDYVYRIGTEVGRGIRFTSVWFDYLFYLIVGYWAYHVYWRQADDKQKSKAVLFWAFLLAAFIVWNIQLVTGFVPYPHNWRRAISPVLLVTIISLLAEAFNRRQFGPAVKKSIAVALIVATTFLLIKKVNNVLVFAKPTEQVLSEYTFNPNIVDSWRWINKNLPAEPKIFSPSFQTSTYLTTYTSARPFLVIGANTPASNYDIEERYLITRKLFNYSNNMVRDRLNGSEDYFYLYSSYFRQKSFDYAFTSSDKYITPEGVGELINRYQFLKASWDDVNANYVYYGPREKELAKYDFAADKRFELLYKNPEVEIYRIKK